MDSTLEIFLNRSQLLYIVSVRLSITDDNLHKNSYKLVGKSLSNFSLVN